LVRSRRAEELFPLPVGERVRERGTSAPSPIVLSLKGEENKVLSARLAFLIDGEPQYRVTGNGV